MNKIKIILLLIVTVGTLTRAYSQEKLDNHQIKSITGTVSGSDAVGNIISIKTADQKEMAFIVPDKAIISQETHNIGLMDIVKSDSVSIQYFVSSSAKNIVVNIVDNESVVNE